MTNQELMALDSQYIMQTYGRFPVTIARGAGARFWDCEGREYIDFTSGIGVNSLGSCNPDWIAAIEQQIHAFGHTSNLFYTEPCVRLAKTLTERTGMTNVFFANGGGEANEGMIKLARKYSFDKYGLGRSNIVTLRQSFHGRTITTLQATGQDVFHNYFFPFTEGFRYAEPDDLESVKAQLRDDSCAVMLELIQGEGGVRPLDPGFVSGLRQLCDQRDLLLLVDEVQTGVGRTGALFAFQKYGILPDVCSFAKGIAGGLPMSGIMAAERCSQVLTPGTHATTFGANPVCAAAASAVLKTLSEPFLEEVDRKGAYLRAGIAALGSRYVRDVRGMGLMIGVGVQNIAHSALCAKLLDAGLLTLTAGSDTLRLLPPLTITYEELDKGLAIMKRVLCPAEG
ncbi:MAG: aspartate aminotransferase family protein [Oscillospiraceae bacterium]|nr:aspartate aminotransferase family protein [Oscillospiraceae bacterium]